MEHSVTLAPASSDVHGLVLSTTGANPVPDLAASLYCGGTLLATTMPVPFSTTGNARSGRRCP
jgi:hypothetical protein